MPRFWDISLDGNRLRQRIPWCDRTALFFFILGLLFNLWVLVSWARQPLLVRLRNTGFRQSLANPLEFRLFQWLVALAYLVTGLPFDPLGRCLSAFFFYGCPTAPERLLALRHSGNEVVRYVPAQRQGRPDVAQTLGNSKLQETGFKVTCTIGPSVPASIYRLDIIQRGSGAQFKMPLKLELVR